MIRPIRSKSIISNPNSCICQNSIYIIARKRNCINFNKSFLKFTNLTISLKLNRENKIPNKINNYEQKWT